MAFEKINLREGLMARMDRKYNSPMEIPINGLLKFSNKLNGKDSDSLSNGKETTKLVSVNQINKVIDRNKFSLGKRLNKRG